MSPAGTLRTGVVPVVVSDQSAFVVFGLNARQFRAFVVEHGVPNLKFRRHTFVRLEHLLEVFDRLAGVEPSRAAPAWSPDMVVEMASRPRARKKCAP